MASSEIPRNFLIDQELPAGTVSAVADVIDLLTHVEAHKLSRDAGVGLFFILETCVSALRHAERSLDRRPERADVEIEHRVAHKPKKMAAQ